MTHGNMDTKRTEIKFNYKEKPPAVTFPGFFLSLLCSKLFTFNTFNMRCCCQRSVLCFLKGVSIILIMGIYIIFDN